MLRYFELQEGTSSKFWEISLNVNTIITRYGKIGTQGKTTQKDLENPVKAQQEFDKLVKEKREKATRRSSGMEIHYCRALYHYL